MRTTASRTLLHHYSSPHFLSTLSQNNNSSYHTSQNIRSASSLFMSSSSVATASCPPSTAFTSSHEEITLLTQQQAAHIDDVLMETFSTDQLMELAGLSVAQVVQTHYQLSGRGDDDRLENDDEGSVQKIVVVCGPGNNGGDGLVAARHLKMFNPTFNVMVVYPRLASVEKPLYKRLLAQLNMCDVPVVTELDERMLLERDGDVRRRRHNTIVIDAMLGYSSRGAVREPYRSMIRTINGLQERGQLRSVAVDIPSGWDVEEGPPPSATPHGETGVVALNVPDVLVSLMAPKQGVRSLMPATSSSLHPNHSNNSTSTVEESTATTAAHYIGGRFVPLLFQKKYQLLLATFPPTGEQFVRIA